MKTIWTVTFDGTERLEVLHTEDTHYVVRWGKYYETRLPVSSCFFTRREAEYSRKMKILQRNQELQEEFNRNTIQLDQIRDYFATGEMN